MVSSRIIEHLDSAILPSDQDRAGLGRVEESEKNSAREKLIQYARTAAEKERRMTLLQGVRLYPKAVAWSVLISTTIVMEGYDVCLINNFCELQF
jgi:SP family general alpha glucoside:H+ symporter-like MFS transporter